MIDFDKKRWDKVITNSDLWWQGKLARPLITVLLTGCQPGRDKPEPPISGLTSSNDFSITPAEIVDGWEYELCCMKFLGDGFPSIWPNFGAGAIAAFLGAILENAENTVWFKSKEIGEIDQLKLEYNPDNIWLRRVKEVVIAANNHWQGAVQIGMTDLGGNLDILSTFRPGERLLLDLYDKPEKVKELTWKAHELWWKYFEEFNALCQPLNPGFTSWAGIPSSKPHYMLQCDFCYMIGPKHFEEFVLPELVASSKRLTNSFYHLDGPNQLAHLDMLLEIEELKGIQWVPGDGQKDVSQWPEVYRKITKANKLIQVFTSQTEKGLEIIDIIADQTGRADNIVFNVSVDIKQENEVEKMLAKYKII